MDAKPHDAEPIGDSRKTWEAPKIVLERLLMVSAQGPNPGGPPFENPQGFIGPLNTSGGTGNCR